MANTTTIGRLGPKPLLNGFSIYTLILQEAQKFVKECMFNSLNPTQRAIFFLKKHHFGRPKMLKMSPHTFFFSQPSFDTIEKLMMVICAICSGNGLAFKKFDQIAYKWPFLGKNVNKCCLF